MKKLLGFYAHGRLGGMVVKDLLADGYEVDLLVRNPNKPEIQDLKKGGANIIPFDFEDFESAHRFITPGTTLYIGGPFGHYLKLIDFIRKHEDKIKISIFISSANAQLFDSYKDYKIYEDTIQATLKKALIIKPTLIFGVLGDGNFQFIANWLKKYPLFPVVGSKKTLYQPVHYEDLKQAIVDSVRAERVQSKAFFIAGRDVLPYGDMIKAIRQKMEACCIIASLPICLLYPLVSVLRRFFKFPLDLEQIKRADMNREADISEAVREIGYAPHGFDERLDQSIALYKEHLP